VGKQEPKFAESYVRLAIHHEMSGDLTGAVIELEKALQAEPRHIHALAQLGQVMMKLENEQAAFKAFDLALKLNPHFARIKPHHEKLKLKTLGQTL
jgi:Tfp pilus assembly protein PilF